MHFSPLLLISLAGSAIGQDTSLSGVKSAFNAANIPSDLSITFNPHFLLEVTLPQPTGQPVILHAGIQLPKNSTVGPPSLSVVGDTGTGPFVIAVVDPDAPTPEAPTVAQIRHLLAPNFFARNPTATAEHRNPIAIAHHRHPTAIIHDLVNTTAAITPFRQPSPPGGTHRYIFLLYRQPAGFNNQTLVNSTTPILLFNISSFAAATGLGAPIAGTFMLVAPDPPAV